MKKDKNSLEIDKVEIPVRPVASSHNVAEAAQAVNNVINVTDLDRSSFQKTEESAKL